MSIYRVQDNAGSFRDSFTITDTTTGTSTDLDYAFVGTNTDQCATWDFAPLCEMQEIEAGEFNNFRKRLHQDDEFVEQQIMMNRRQDIFHTAGTGVGTTLHSLHHFAGQFNDSVTDTTFTMTSDLRYGRNLPPLGVRILYYIPSLRPIIRLASKIMKPLKLNRSDNDIIREHAERKTKKLTNS